MLYTLISLSSSTLNRKYMFLRWNPNLVRTASVPLRLCHMKGRCSDLLLAWLESLQAQEDPKSLT